MFINNKFNFRILRDSFFKSRIFMGRLAVLSVIIMLCGFFSGCSLPKQTLTDPVNVTGYKLNTYVSIDSYTNVSKNVLNEALALCDYYEKKFSRTMAGSDIYKVNHGETNEIDEETASLIQSGLYYSQLSEGAFDITIGSVSSLWDFTADKPVVPDSSAISEAVKHVGYTNVSLNKKEDSDNYIIDMPEGTMLDLGAIAKGYIADRIKDYLVDKGVTSAIINLGGNCLCIGGKTATSSFTIGIKKPFTQTGELLLKLSINGKSVVSSGTYERYFYENGNFYHHILNPSTGYPYDNHLTNVSIISDLSLDGDCLSTTCFALGLDDGLKLIESLDGIEAVFVTDDGNIYYSSNTKSYLVD